MRREVEDEAERLEAFLAEPEEAVSNVFSGSLTSPFIALVWTLLYFRLRQAKSEPAEPAAPAPIET